MMLSFIQNTRSDAFIFLTSHHMDFGLSKEKPNGCPVLCSLCISNTFTNKKETSVP